MRPRDLGELLVLALLWGSAYLFMRAAVPAFGPAGIVALRLGIAVAVLLPVLLLRGGAGALRTHAGPLLVLGTVFNALPFFLLAFASLTITAGWVAILNSTAPLFAALVGRVWLRERLGGWRAAGLLLGIAGVVLLVWGRLDLTAGAATGIAVLAVLGSSALWGLGANYTRLRLTGVDAVPLSVGSLAVSTVMMAPFAIADWPAEPPGLQAWAEVAFLGIASSGIGFLLYFRLLRNVGPVRAISVTFLNPVVAMASAAAYLGEAVTLQMLAGCAVILAGTALTLGLWPRRPL